MKYPFSGGSAAELFPELEAIGNANHQVRFAANLSNVDIESIAFCTYLDVEKVAAIHAGVLIVDQKTQQALSKFNSQCIVFSPAPKYHFVEFLAKHFDDSFQGKFNDKNGKISQDAYVEKGAKLGDNISIFPNASVFSCVELGNNCMVQSGTVLGGNGLGDVPFEGKYHRFTHLGEVIVGDDVHFGCNVTVLRGMLEDTIIGAGTRIANNVNVGHNVVIGKNCYISSGVTIGGACVIKDNVWLAPGASLVDHIEIGENTMIGTGAVVVKDALPNSVYLGNPARKIRSRETDANE